MRLRGWTDYKTETCEFNTLLQAQLRNTARNTRVNDLAPTSVVSPRCALSPMPTPICQRFLQPQPRPTCFDATLWLLRREWSVTLWLSCDIRDTATEPEVFPRLETQLVSTCSVQVRRSPPWRVSDLQRRPTRPCTSATCDLGCGVPSDRQVWPRLMCTG